MRKHKGKIWPLGFLGFLSLGYFTENNLGDLWFIAFFGFFAFYFIDKIDARVSDEMLLENSYKAKDKTIYIPLISVFIIGFCLSHNLFTKELVIILLALTFAVTLISYAGLLNYYEKNLDL